MQIGGGAQPEIMIHETDERLPWSGHGGRHAIVEIYEAIRRHKTTLIFSNTRAQAELTFQELWRINEDTLPIALHHGSLDVGQRRKVEAAMAEGRLKAIVATSTLDLGIDWGDVDLVVHMGSPKGVFAADPADRAGEPPARRALARDPRAGEPLRSHRMRGRARRGACGRAGRRRRQGAAGSTCWRSTCSASPAAGRSTRTRSTRKWPRPRLTRRSTARPSRTSSQFVATGGYALKSYERFAKIRKTKDGLWRVSNPATAQRWRMNVGTIIEASTLKVRLGRVRRTADGAVGQAGFGGRTIGEIEEYFVETMTPGDTFMFGGEILRYEALIESDVFVTRSASEAPKVPTYVGGRMPLTSDVAARVRAMLADPESWRALPDQTREWLSYQAERSRRARQRPPAGRDLSARRQEFSGRLSVRGPARAPDARHAADAQAGARPCAAARFRGERLRASRSGASAISPR